MENREHLDLKYLHYALAVARYGSVTQAARKLYLAQPNLSRAIGELEESLGFPLFLRSRRGMALTPQGKRFLGEAEALLEQLSRVARECRQANALSLRISCVPSSLFVNSALELARRHPSWAISCEEHDSCTDLLDQVAHGASLAAFLTFGASMKEDLISYLARRNLSYHPLAQSPAYGVLRQSSNLYHPETHPPSICYEDALLLLSTTYFEPIGIYFQPEKSSLPAAKGVCHGVGRAGNLDMLASIDPLVMISCHVHSKILARNGLAAVPLQPESMAYEYGCVTKAGAPFPAESQGILAELEEIIRQEVDAPSYFP